MNTIAINRDVAAEALLHLTQEAGLLVSMSTICLGQVVVNKIDPEAMGYFADHIARLTAAMSVCIGVLQLPHPIVEMTVERVAELQARFGVAPAPDTTSTDLPH